MALGMYHDHQIKVFITFTSSLCPVYQPTELWNASVTHLPVTCTPNMKAVCSSKSLDNDIKKTPQYCHHHKELQTYTCIQFIHLYTFHRS